MFGLAAPAIVVALLVFASLATAPTFEAEYLGLFGRHSRAVLETAARHRVYLTSLALVFASLGAIAVAVYAIFRPHRTRGAISPWIFVVAAGVLLVALFLLEQATRFDTSAADAKPSGHRVLGVLFRWPQDALDACGAQTASPTLVLIATATSVAAVCLVVFAKTANLQPLCGKDRIRRLWEAIGLHRTLLYASACVLSLVVVALGEWLDWPAAACGAGEEAAVVIETWNDTLTRNVGLSHTLVLAAVYLPGVVCFRARVLRTFDDGIGCKPDETLVEWRKRHGFDRTMFEEILPILAMSAPFLGGFVADLVKNIA